MAKTGENTQQKNWKQFLRMQKLRRKLRLKQH